MDILVIGAGAREHSLLLGLRRDPGVGALHVAPGNVGMGMAHRHAIDISRGADVVALARSLKVDLVVVGPEVPLVAGVADALAEAGVAVFGPSARAAQIEGSKAFAKDVMAAANVRTARAESINSSAQVDAALDRFGPNWVVKDDGLAAGKGVVVTDDRAAARAHAIACLDDGHPVLLESYLEGPEVSLFCLVDGETVVPLLPAQDHKRVGDADTGPNTGGMGAYTPLPWLPAGMVDQIVDEVCVPVAREMVRRGCAFSGLLYAGLAITSEGPSVVEFNCRFGDPETQAVLALLESPLGRILHSVASGTLDQLESMKWSEEYAVAVVLAAENYPEQPRFGDVILGTESHPQEILHAGTALNDEGSLVSSGGRVISVVGTGADLASARARAYSVMSSIEMRGGHFRTDIGAAAERGEITIPQI